jgi:membrane-associated phospholipid phosphatase
MFQYFLLWAGPVIILAALPLRKEPGKRWQDAVTVIGFTVYLLISFEVLLVLVHCTPHTLDVAFLRADRALGFDAFAFGGAIGRHRLVTKGLTISYLLLSAAIGLAWVAEQNLTLRRAMLLAGCGSFFFYAAFPAVGPGHFDWRALAPQALCPRNCMPSMHVTWALLLAINARSRRLAAALWVYAAIMTVSTVALGEHYFIDLIAAVPYTVAAQWTARKITPERTA